MRLWSKMPCHRCSDESVARWSVLHWQSVTQNGLTVHRVPVYTCPSCGEETIELQSACVYDAQVQAAYDSGVTEITLFYGDLTIAEPHSPCTTEEVDL